MRKKLFVHIILFAFLLSVVPAALAQEIGGGTATGIKISEKGIKNGDIITAITNGYKRSTEPYDPFLYGVVTLDPAVYIQDENAKDQTPVVTQGQVQVRVTTSNGPIKKNDFITSSTIPGVGQKATDNGTVIGTANEDYTEKDPKKIGVIVVTLHPHFARLSNNVTANAMKGLSLGATAALQSPMGALRYIVAGVITLLSFFFGFRFFGRASRSGVEAIGRNPLASKSIMFSVAINASITVAIMLFGVAISYLILVL